MSAIGSAGSDGSDESAGLVVVLGSAVCVDSMPEFKAGSVDGVDAEGDADFDVDVEIDADGDAEVSC